MITQQELKNMIIYNPDTGVFCKMFESDNCYLCTPTKRGHVYLMVEGVKYSMRQLIWLYMTGEHPDHPIYLTTNDINDLRWCNITDDQKEAYRKTMKLSKRNTSGCVGVSWYEREQRWIATIMRNGVKKHLGSFNTLDEAVATRKIAEIF